ncbi:MAG: hypothetical protein IPG07_04315 [Crocinitomicaceae bacterium]|nr:hypothetical protein [Crocinitomicaceae bacterium]
MKKLLLLTITFLSFVSASISQDTYSRIKLYGTDAELYEATQLGVTLDHGQHKLDLWFIADLSESEIEILQTNGYNFEILIADVSAYYVENSTSTSHVHKDDR